jgi:hypothetical protein
MAISALLMLMTLGMLLFTRITVGEIFMILGAIKLMLIFDGAIMLIMLGKSEFISIILGKSSITVIVVGILSIMLITDGISKSLVIFMMLGNTGISWNVITLGITFGFISDMVEGIDIDPYIFRPFWLRFHYHLYLGPGIIALNKAVLNKIKDLKPDMLWVDNKPYLKAWALKIIRNDFPDMKIVNLITDDPFGSYSYCWKLIYHTFKYYDIHFVQRSINISELKRKGAKRVEICYRSFDPEFHRPLPEIQKLRNPKKLVIGFIGSYEEEREAHIAYLVKNGIDVEITGNGWTEGKEWNLLKDCYKGPSVFGDGYVEAINRMDIALHFLRKINRDQQDSRTFEIPACNVFMLAERSYLHQELFTEGDEVDFFTSKEELLQKLKYYLANPELRLQMAAAAYNRSFTSGYFHESRLNKVIECIIDEQPKNKKIESIVVGIYIDPDFYPPTINAIINLSEISEEVVVVTRNHTAIDFPYPSNVRLVKLGKLMTVLETEQKSILSKFLSFTKFSFYLWK